MNSITQDMLFRLSLVRAYDRLGATKAAIRYKVNRQLIYFWLDRYDGDIHSLADHSHKPHSNPKQHSEEELKWIRDLRKRNPTMGLCDFWLRLKTNHVYSRSIVSLYRVMRKLGMFPKAVKETPKPTPKPYQKALYPGEKVQIDVKYVPEACLVGALKDTKLYQYTAIDEFSRFRYLAFFPEKSTYTSTQFLLQLMNAFKFRIHRVQTDNGLEFTNRLVSDKPTLFEITLDHYGIPYQKIKPMTPRHNGKVERSHREDKKRFYKITTFYSLDDAQKQLSKYLKHSNDRPMRPLAYLTPKQVLQNYYSNL